MIPYMTPEEIRETLLRMLDKLDELYGDRSHADSIMRRERDAHAREVVNLRSEIAAKDRILTEKERCLTEKDRCLIEKDNRIASLEKELAESKTARANADHKIRSMNQEKYQGTSKNGIDSKHQTQKGREDDKYDFDGTPGSACPRDATTCRNGEGVETGFSGRTYYDNLLPATISLPC